MFRTLILMLILPISAYCQFAENFSDGELSIIPEWLGDTGLFDVNNDFELQLQAPAEAGSAFIYTPSASINMATWEFMAKFDFNPSSSNYLKVFIVSDTINNCGYYVMVGNSSDEVSLYRYENEKETKIIDGIDKRLNTSSVNVKVKVTRDEFGYWNLYSNTLGGANFVEEGDCFDNSILFTHIFGVECIYTSTRSTKFYFDDIEVDGDAYVDLTFPVVDSVLMVAANKLVVYYSELIDEDVMTDRSNYMLNGQTHPMQIVQLGDNIVELTYEYYFNEGMNAIMVDRVIDSFGNESNNQTANFSYYSVSQFDVVINEVMADPSPVVELPEYEYVELYNRTNHSIDLTKWTITIGDNILEMPNNIIGPKDFLLLTPNGYSLDIVPDAIQVSLPALPNDGQTMCLRDSSGTIIHFINYNKDWYGMPAKSEGGWSLEQIDARNPCGEIDNWTASESKEGGTPGEVNSVDAINNDEAHPEIIALSVLSENSVKAIFDESLITDMIVVSETLLGDPDSVVIVGPDNKEIIIYFEKEMIAGLIYTLSISSGVDDCVGNEYIKEDINFGLSQEVEAGDVIINEVLFNPYPDGVDFIEIYNNSDKIIDLGSIRLAERDDNGDIYNVSALCDEQIQCFPNEYKLIATDYEGISTFYYAAESAFVKINEMPAYNNDNDEVLVLDKQLNVIDELVYSDQMHFELLLEDEGVSLERLSFNEQTNNLTNWHSASETAGYATPGYDNSQSAANQFSNNEVVVAPEMFSPDNDGVDDVVMFNYEFDRQGVVGTAIIYDNKGRRVHMLLNNEMLGSKGVLFWDGITANNVKSGIGIYVAFFEFFTIDGWQKKIKKSFVLTSRK